MLTVPSPLPHWLRHWSTVKYTDNRTRLIPRVTKNAFWFYHITYRDSVP